MVCFHYNGQTLHSYCKQRGIPYYTVYRRIDDGKTTEQAIQDAIAIKTSGRNPHSHPRIYYKGKPLVDAYVPSSYRKVIARMNRGKGMSLEQAIQKGGLFEKETHAR